MASHRRMIIPCRGIGSEMSPANGEGKLPRLYGDLADWFHLLTAPEDYAAEAAFLAHTCMNEGMIYLFT